MKINNLKNYIGGWIVGAFQPNIIWSDEVEVAVHHYKKGFQAVPHIHKIAREINIVVKGKVKVDCFLLTDGDLWVFEPNEFLPVEYLEDTDLVVIKSPSLPGDKFDI